MTVVILKDSYPSLQNIFLNQFKEHCNRESKINKNLINLTSYPPILFNFFVKMLNKFGEHSSVLYKLLSLPPPKLLFFFLNDELMYRNIKRIVCI